MNRNLQDEESLLFEQETRLGAGSEWVVSGSPALTWSVGGLLASFNLPTVQTDPDPPRFLFCPLPEQQESVRRQSNVRILQFTVSEVTAGSAPTCNLILESHLDDEVVGNQPPRGKFEKWYAKLQGLSQLNQGWDSYKAPAPTPLALRTAESYLDILRLVRWEPARLDASVMGGVGITHRVGTRKVYVEFYNDGKVHALFSDRDRPRDMETTRIRTDVQSYYRFIAKARGYLNG